MPDSRVRIAGHDDTFNTALGGESRRAALSALPGFVPATRFSTLADSSATRMALHDRRAQNLGFLTLSLTAVRRRYGRYMHRGEGG